MALNYESRISEESKMRASDRIFVLEVIDGTLPKDTIGMIDPSLFKEKGNRLHCVMDTHTTFWSFRYERGDVPAPLKSQFTSFSRAKDHAENYFKNRNVRIKEVIGA